MQVEIYSDISCPWCYIGEKRFSAALAGYSEPVDVVFRPYQLDPTASATPRPLVEALREKFGTNAEPMLARVTEAARGEGITMHWERAVAVNTLTAHRLLQLALRDYGAGVQRALVEQLFDAHFTNGGDVSDATLLADLAASVGMDRARTRDYLDSSEGLADTRAAIDAARELGIGAVPTFVFDEKYLVEGGQPSAVFADVLREVARLTAAEHAGVTP